MKNIEKNLKIPYLYFISTKLDSKSAQIKGLELKKSKIKKKKRERIGKMAQKGKKDQFFFHETNSQNKTKKMSFAKLNSVQWLERYSLSHTC